MREKKNSTWVGKLPETVRILLEKGYLEEVQPAGGCPKVEGFLAFDADRIAEDVHSDPQAVLAAEVYSLLPWIGPDNSEIAAESLLKQRERKPFHEIAGAIFLWLCVSWNNELLGRATGWPQYELREQTVEGDVFQGFRSNGKSSLMATGYLLHLDNSRQVELRLNEAAGALRQLVPERGGPGYRGPMVWADVRGNALLLYLTPHELASRDFESEFFEQLGRIPGLDHGESGSRLELPERAVPIFGLDRDTDAKQILLRFLTPMWWNDEVFASIRSSWSAANDFSLRLPLMMPTSMVETMSYGPLVAQNALYRYAKPDQ